MGGRGRLFYNGVFPPGLLINDILLFMRNNLKLIWSTFTRQQNSNDCGLACLISIFKYAGINAPDIVAGNTGKTSLLELHQLASRAGIISRCVRMDIQTLKNNPSPCILHTINDAGQPHFIVHYPCSVGVELHLIGDPDRKLELITEQALLQKWDSRAALFIEKIKPRNNWSYRFFPWNNFTQFKFIPKMLWLSVPLLNIIAALLGLAVSLVIQKALEPGFLNGKPGFFVVLFALLVLLSAVKCALNYLRQWMIISLGSKMDSTLSLRFLSDLYQAFKPTGLHFTRYYLKTIADIQKIQQAAALLVGVVFSDGLLIMIMFGCLWFYQPLLVFFQVATFLAMVLMIDKYLPLLLIHYDNSQLAPVNSVDQLAHLNGGSGEEIDYRSFAENYSRINDGFAKKSKSLSVVVNRINLSFDIIGTINMIAVVIFTICQLQLHLISYESFLMAIVLCYGMVMLMTKICNQLLTIAQGAERLKQNLTSVSINVAPQ
jgi:ATP-binding cassette, subfamily C, bacteriocin exporter